MSKIKDIRSAVYNLMNDSTDLSGIKIYPNSFVSVDPDDLPAILTVLTNGDYTNEYFDSETVESQLTIRIFEKVTVDLDNLEDILDTTSDLVEPVVNGGGTLQGLLEEKLVKQGFDYGYDKDLGLAFKDLKFKVKYEE